MKILVCLDGEPHTSGAIEHAINLGLAEKAEVIGLHVVDPWLRQFYSEIYAQGRKEYLEWVDACLKAEALEAGEAFDALCNAQGLEADFRIRHGEPLAEILEEIGELSPDLVITGGKPLNAWGRFRSGNLPAKLERSVGAKTSVVSVNGSDQPAAISPELIGAEISV
ncbi:MAG: universal stress protein [Gammaproteobacteria bacterium]|nr:universal stress protein [Gammaproteobacteria bacterium]MDH3507789.1 universal stress protein [Gammaproteobacteria bacterium]